MTRRKTFGTRAIAFISALLFAMTLVLLFPVGTFRANAETVYVTTDDANMNISGTIKLGNKILQPNDEVKNGDTLSLNVEWSLPDFTEIKDRVFVYDLTGKLHGITLTSTTIDVENAKYVIKDNKLYITVKTQFTSGIVGYCGLSGTVNVGSLDENNQYGLQFMDTVVPVFVTDLIPKLNVYKSSGTVTYKDGKYYQEFTINVKSDTQPAHSVTITDSGESGLDFSNIENLSVKYGNNNPVDCLPVADGNGFKLVLPEVGNSWDSEVRITYSVPVDVDGILDGTAGKNNTVTATADKLTPASATASAKASKPSISKSGKYEDGKLVWTITVNTGSYSLLNPEFTVTDIPGLNLDEEDVIAAIGSLTIDKTAFTDNGNGTYTYTYKTEPDAANQLTDTTYKNSASVKFTDITGTPEFTSDEASAVVGKSLSEFVDKTYGAMDSNRNLTWNIKVEMPDIAAKSVTINDYFSSTDKGIMDYDTFKVNGTYTIVSNNNYNNNKQPTDIGYYSWNKADNFNLKIVDTDFLNDIAANDKDIVLSYSTAVPDGVVQLTNFTDVTIETDDTAVSDNDSETFKCDTAQKYVTTTQQFPTASQYEFPVVWGIKFLVNEPLKVGDKITVVDTLPEGFTYVSSRVSARDDTGYSVVPQDCLSATVSGNTVTFVLTVTQALIDEDINASWDEYAARIIYLTHADKEHDNIYLNGATTYTNTASVKIRDTDIGKVSSDVTLEPDDSEVVTKDCVTTPASENESAYASYTISINPNKDNLSPGDTLTATDTLGSRLTLDESSIKVIPDAPFNVNGQVITFTLQDETSYVITYKANFVAISSNGGNTGFTPEQEKAMFGNSITVGDVGNTSFSTNTVVGEYKVEGGATSEEQLASITLSGTKTWLGDNKSIRPKEIVIKLTAYHTYPDMTTTQETLTYTVNSQIIDENGNWTYTIDKLATLTSNGRKTTYDVEEVTVDGYEMAYSGDLRTGLTCSTEGAAKNYTINIANNFVADDNEIGDLVVTKEWIDDNASVRPAINIVLTSESGAVIEEKLTGDSVTFENLPLYSYSRNSETDALERTPIKYQLSEAGITTADQTKLNSYDMDAGDWFTLVDDDTIRTKLATPVAKNIKNTYTENTKVSVEKVWADNNNQDDIRPAEVTIKLLADNVDTGKSVVLNESNSWKSAFDNLDKFNGGKEIKYTIEEVAVTGYSSVITGNMADGFVVTNTYTPATVNIPIEKVWADNNNQDGIRPTEVTIKLLADNVDTGKSVVLDENNKWKAEFADLDKFNGGKEIKYTIEEVAVTGYTTSIANGTTGGFVVTNTHTSEKTAVAVKKVWEDDNNRDNVRPASVTIKLLADGADTGKSVVLDENNKWKAEFADLDKYKAGNKINYTIAEVAVTNYTSVITGNVADGFVVTNTHNLATTSISGTKTWVDNNDAAGKRPASIKVTLYGNGVKVAEKEVTAADNWKYTFDNLILNENGTPIVYKVAEDTVSEYTPTYSGYNITNTYDPGKTFINVTKVWEDDNNRDNIRPVEITVNLLANGQVIDTQKLNASNNWTYFAGLDMYDSEGKEITYSVAEVNVPDGYSSVITGGISTGFTVTNTHSPATTQVSVKKVWADNNNQDGIRPKDVTVKLLADGYETGLSVVLNEANSWNHTFTGLEKLNGGTAIVYTVEEAVVPTGYNVNVTGDMTTGFVVTNTHTTAVTSVNVKKVWDDNSNAAGKRPDSITVKLLANGSVIQTATVKESDNWEYTFDNLAVNSNGTAIIYTVDEDVVTGYTKSINGFVITNKYDDNSTPPANEKISVSVEKRWVDSNNMFGGRPGSISVNLLANGKTIASVVLNNSNNWMHTFTDLDKYSNGVEIMYTVEEATVPAGYRSTLSGNMYSGFVITNTRPSPVLVIRPDPKPIPPEDVSSEAGISVQSDMLEVNNTTSYSLIAILIAVTTGGIVIVRRRRQK